MLFSVDSNSVAKSEKKALSGDIREMTDRKVIFTLPLEEPEVVVEPEPEPEPEQEEEVLEV